MIQHIAPLLLSCDIKPVYLPGLLYGLRTDIYQFDLQSGLVSHLEWLRNNNATAKAFDRLLNAHQRYDVHERNLTNQRKFRISEQTFQPNLAPVSSEITEFWHRQVTVVLQTTNTSWFAVEIRQSWANGTITARSHQIISIHLVWEMIEMMPRDEKISPTETWRRQTVWWWLRR